MNQIQPQSENLVEPKQPLTIGQILLMIFSFILILLPLFPVYIFLSQYFGDDGRGACGVGRGDPLATLTALIIISMPIIGFVCSVSLIKKFKKLSIILAFINLLILAIVIYAIFC